MTIGTYTFIFGIILVFIGLILVPICLNDENSNLTEKDINNIKYMLSINGIKTIEEMNQLTIALNKKMQDER